MNTIQTGEVGQIRRSDSGSNLTIDGGCWSRAESGCVAQLDRDGATSSKAIINSAFLITGSKGPIDMAIKFVDLQFGVKIESIEKYRRTFHWLISLANYSKSMQNFEKSCPRG